MREDGKRGREKGREGWAEREGKRITELQFTLHVKSELQLTPHVNSELQFILHVKSEMQFVFAAMLLQSLSTYIFKAKVRQTTVLEINTIPALLLVNGGQ